MARPPADTTPLDKRRFASDIATVDNQHRIALPKSFLQPHGWLDSEEPVVLLVELGAPGYVRLTRLEESEEALQRRHGELLAAAEDGGEAIKALQTFEDRYRIAPFYRKRDGRIKLHEAVFLHLGLDLSKPEQRVFARVSDDAIEVMSLGHRGEALAADHDGWLEVQ